MEVSETRPEHPLLDVGSAADTRRGRLVFGLPFLPGWRGELLVLAFFALATLVLTWPVAISLDRATGIRGDYFNNVWNVWWLKHSIVEGHSPWSTDYLYFPDGLSLKRHTLSLVNALAGVGLSTFLGPHQVFNVLMLATFVASAWCFSLFARYMTGSTSGAVLAGLVYSFNPFHYYYICQVNVFTFEFLPLVLLYFARTYREGGWRNPILAAVFTGLLAASIEYYVIYAFLAVGLLLVCGRLFDREVRWTLGARRLMVAGLLTAVVVGVVAFPLIYGTFGPEADVSGAGEFSYQRRRSNDLLGYFWVGGPELATVSWPTMLGYSTLLLLLATAKRWFRRQAFWVLVGVVFGVLSLGQELYVARVETGVPLPYGALAQVPGLDMLRKPDRCFLLVQFVVALLAAEAWVGLGGRLASGAKRGAAWLALATLMMVELTGVPFLRFDYDLPPYTEVLAADEAESAVDMPPMPVDVMNARYNFLQTGHGKKQPLGYCTALALTEAHHHQMQIVVNLYLSWIRGRDQALPRWIRERGLDRVVLHKTVTLERPADPSIHERLYFEPFFFVRRELVGIRQTGQFVDRTFEELDPPTFLRMRAAARRQFGPPIHEDEDVVIYDVAGGP